MTSKKAIYISFDYTLNKVSGGSYITERNLDIIKNYFKNNLFLYGVKRNKFNLKIINFIIDLYYFTIGGLDKLQLREIQNIISNNSINIVIIDSTCLGKITKYIKKHNLDVKIVVISHNFEPKSYFDNYKLTFNFLYLFRSLVCLYNEYLACLYANHIITTTTHDLRLYKKIYNRNINNDIVIPVSVNKNQDYSINKTFSKTGLFVGSWFPPNIHGIKWFISNVLPYIDSKLIVVGSGMDNLLPYIPQKLMHKVEINDFVSDLSPYYHKADYIISPIFYGSGMKVKIAEALEYNKSIFCTLHSHIGYEIYPTHNKLVVCNSANDFINSITSFIELGGSVGFYSNKYCNDNIAVIFNDFFNKIFAK